MPRFIPNPAGFAATSKMVAAELTGAAEQLAAEIRAAIPVEAVPGTGTALAEPGAMRASIKVGVNSAGHVEVYSDEWRIAMIEFGFMDRAGDFLTFGAPIRSAAERWAHEHGWVFIGREHGG